MNSGRLRSAAIAIVCAAIVPGLNSTAQQALAPSNPPPPTITVNVTRVLIPVVVRDAHGHSVGNLRKEDFQVFDNNKPQPISGFMVESRAPQPTRAVGDTASPAPESAAPPRPRPRFVIFLFDDMHLEAQDLAHVQQAGAKAVAETLGESDYAAVISVSGKTNTGVTRDRAKLLDAIKGLKPMLLYRSSSTECPYIQYYQADLIENKHDSGALAEAVRQVFSCNPEMDQQRDLDTAQRLAESTAMQVQMVGRQDVQSTFTTIRALVHALAALPGQGILVLVSPGFLTVESDTLSFESQIIDIAASANVIISALDARGLYTTSMTASQDGSKDPLYQSDIRRRTLEADENPLSELADGTGGAFFHNNNDLDTGLRDLTAAPEHLYLIDISPDNLKPDGSYHRLKVKVDQPGVQIQARHGYSIPKPKKTKK